MFIADVGANMASKSSGRDKCDLDVGMDYVRSVLFEKVSAIEKNKLSFHTNITQLDLEREKN